MDSKGNPVKTVMNAMLLREPTKEIRKSGRRKPQQNGTYDDYCSAER